MSFLQNLCFIEIPAKELLIGIKDLCANPEASVVGPPLLLFSLSIVIFLLDFLPNFMQQVCLLPGVRLRPPPPTESDEGSSESSGAPCIPAVVEGTCPRRPFT